MPAGNQDLKRDALTLETQLGVPTRCPPRGSSSSRALPSSGLLVASGADTGQPGPCQPRRVGPQLPQRATLANRRACTAVAGRLLPGLFTSQRPQPAPRQRRAAPRQPVQAGTWLRSPVSRGAPRRLQTQGTVPYQSRPDRCWAPANVRPRPSQPPFPSLARHPSHLFSLHRPDSGSGCDGAGIFSTAQHLAATYHTVLPARHSLPRRTHASLTSLICPARHKGASAFQRRARHRNNALTPAHGESICIAVHHELTAAESNRREALVTAARTRGRDIQACLSNLRLSAMRIPPTSPPTTSSTDTLPPHPHPRHQAIPTRLTAASTPDTRQLPPTAARRRLPSTDTSAARAMSWPGHDTSKQEQ